MSVVAATANSSRLFHSLRSAVSHHQNVFHRNLNTTSTRFSQKPSRPLIARYTDEFPFELARVQSGRHVNLRDYETQVSLKRFSYDLKMKDGLVLPADGEFFIGPNGCSLREPSSPTFQEIVRNFRGGNIFIFVIPKGTPLPNTLTILHEHSDHFSLQCTRPMALTELNDELTKFINGCARVLDKEQFDKEYPFSI